MPVVKVVDSLGLVRIQLCDTSVIIQSIDQALGEGKIEVAIYCWLRVEHGVHLEQFGACTNPAQ